MKRWSFYTTGGLHSVGNGNRLKGEVFFGSEEENISNNRNICYSQLDNMGLMKIQNIWDVLLSHLSFKYDGEMRERVWLSGRMRIMLLH